MGFAPEHEMGFSVKKKESDNFILKERLAMMAVWLTRCHGLLPYLASIWQAK